MTSSYYQRKGITLGLVAQFCKELGLSPSRLQHFQVATQMLEIAKCRTYIDDNPRPICKRFPGVIIQPICKN